jgi:hypothetical protein
MLIYLLLREIVAFRIAPRKKINTLFMSTTMILHAEYPFALGGYANTYLNANTLLWAIVDQYCYQ